MTSTTESIEILKQDTKGRVRVPVERREALLEEFDRSGVSAVRFAELVGVKYQTFAGWQRKRRQKAAEAGEPGRSAPGVHWLEAVVSDRVEAGSRSAVLQVDLPGGVRLQIGDREQAMLAAELLVAMGGGRRC